MPKIKIPDALKKYRKMKQSQNTNTCYEAFPCIKIVAERIKSLSVSPDKRISAEYFIPKYLNANKCVRKTKLISSKQHSLY